MIITYLFFVLKTSRLVLISPYNFHYSLILLLYQMQVWVNFKAGPCYTATSLFIIIELFIKQELIHIHWYIQRLQTEIRIPHYNAC